MHAEGAWIGSVREPLGPVPVPLDLEDGRIERKPNVVPAVGRRSGGNRLDHRFSARRSLDPPDSLARLVSLHPDLPGSPLGEDVGILPARGKPLGALHAPGRVQPALCKAQIVRFPGIPVVLAADEEGGGALGALCPRPEELAGQFGAFLRRKKPVVEVVGDGEQMSHPLEQVLLGVLGCQCAGQRRARQEGWLGDRGVPATSQDEDRHQCAPRRECRHRPFRMHMHAYTALTFS